ncbi:unnamed protein product [Gongylonema pulchrum]|uniref:Transmembrane protein n=1 Tax=Gongylonema pulchrum TaxID=637853 RepID=A0A183DDD0_9BILA|nr:unnamed protein product [Gongylonema pulchrum]
MHLGNNAYGVVLEEGTNYIKSFSTAILDLFISAPDEDEPVLYEWQLEVQRHLDDPEFSLLRIGITSDSLVSAEVRRMGMETAPLLAGSILGMILFVVGSSFRSAKPLFVSETNTASGE